MNDDQIREVVCFVFDRKTKVNLSYWILNGLNVYRLRDTWSGAFKIVNYLLNYLLYLSPISNWLVLFWGITI